MRTTITRGLIAATLAATTLTGLATTATADPVIVDQPDTSQLNDIYTFAPLGIPVFGLIQSIVRAPTYILPQ
ncbi:hypothetical protein [Actinokineospora bangkokensis]|uniref:Secreted protein n=1 Tax=Actinokineospora bangkokensis TaxID=1193682 RepID=A0A1Q9LH48_9PSEU|nr:hypothetical protein [Actinokineospora bangkokensis]OLR91269.1 hypothetical protein BJP25_26740 [Actinokineospora bangkokensis]